MTPATSAYLSEKLATLERLVHDEAARCEVEIGRAVGHSQQGNVWKAEIVITFAEANSASRRMYAIAHEESVHAAIDIAKDEMLRQLRKGKDKNTSLVRRMGARLKRWARRGDIRSY